MCKLNLNQEQPTYLSQLEYWPFILNPVEEQNPHCSFPKIDYH